ncbi:MAG: hypothetical protein QOE28_2178 [Solirubrobacteraceae bacterium]|jgi:hypothetical protein|nr:hypothetical protein [Solirubrobacteraceae bacterium]
MHNALTPPVAIEVIKSLRADAEQAHLVPRRRRTARRFGLRGRGGALRHAVPRGRIHTPAVR